MKKRPYSTSCLPPVPDEAGQSAVDDGGGVGGAGAVEAPAAVLRNVFPHGTMLSFCNPPGFQYAPWEPRQGAADGEL